MIKHASLFSQLIAVFNRNQFFHLVYQHQSERYAKGFSSWDQSVAMLFCHLAHAKSLREICGGLACCTGKLRHLNMRQAPKKSTLSYANTHRPWEMFRDLFYHTLDTCNTAPGQYNRSIYFTVGIPIGAGKDVKKSGGRLPGPATDTAGKKPFKFRETQSSE